jgi:hypothetical protein
MQTITVSTADVDLYHVAAVQWGDATAWLALAAANALTDPVIYGVMDIVIPDWDPSFSGGAPQQ